MPEDNSIANVVIEQSKIEHLESEQAPNLQTDRNRVAAALSYVPFLCFLPMILKDKQDKRDFLGFHARQGLVITLMTVVMAILGPVLTLFVPIVGAMLAFCLDVALAFMIIIGAMKAYQGDMWELPYVGAYAKKVKL